MTGSRQSVGLVQGSAESRSRETRKTDLVQGTVHRPVKNRESRIELSVEKD